MARNIDTAIEEEERRELREAEDLEEQQNEKEYDASDENTAPTVGSGGAVLEFVCTKCGKRLTARHNSSPVHHGKEMTPIDKEPVRAGVFGRLLHAIRHATHRLTGRKHASTGSRHGTAKPAKAKPRRKAAKRAKPKARKAARKPARKKSRR